MSPFVRSRSSAIARKEAEAAGKLLTFPKPIETYSTPALQAASEAGADHVPAPTKKIEAVAAPKVHRLQETKQQRFRRAMALERDLTNGLTLGDDDALWLGGYRNSAEYAAMKHMVEEFGEDAALG